MFFLLILASLSTLVFYHFYWKRRDLPPGPTPLPIFGNALGLKPYSKEPPYHILKSWQEKYGDVYTYWLGSTPIVAVNEYGLMKETFIKDGESYTGRNLFDDMVKELRGGHLGGVLASDGEFWQDQRRFALRVLRDFGMGRDLIEDMIMVEVDRLLSKAQEAVDTRNPAADLSKVVDICVGSIINQLLLGYRFVGDNESEFYRLKALLNEQIYVLGHPLGQLMMLGSLKFWKKVPIFDKFYERMMNANLNIQKFLKAQVEGIQEKFKTEGIPEEATNFVQAFLMEMSKRERNGDVGNYTFQQLLDMCNDMWGAGQETTSATTNFGILFIMTHPEAQTKMQAELDRVVGNDRKIGLTDRPKLPYTNAVCNEVQRLCNLLPQNLFHRTTKDVYINGYKIKQGTTIVPQISCVLFDKKVFPNPESFEPERFLDANGKLKRVDEFIPFSVGKRACLGESLARNELFLFLANLFHEFKIRPTDPNQTLEKINGFGAQPPPYKCNCERRIPMIP